MRPTSSLITTLLLSSSLAQACLTLTGYHDLPGDILSLSLVDNGIPVCSYNGWYEHGYQVWLSCVEGFYAFAGPNDQGGLLPIIGYAHGGRDYRLKTRIGSGVPREIVGKENAWEVVGMWFC